MTINQTKRLLDKYRPLLLELLLCFCYFSGSSQTYNPSVCCTVSNKAYGAAQAVSTDGRSWFYDVTNFVMRDYNGPTEVLSYLNLAKYRSGHFPIYVHTGGILQTNGIWIGGSTLVYWFKDSTGNANLVRWYTDSTGIAGGPFYAVANNLSEGNAGLIKGNLALDLVNNTSDAQKNAASVSLINHTINGNTNTLINIPNSALTNNSTGLTVTAAAGSDITVPTTPAALGSSLVLNIPSGGPSSRGAITSTDWNTFNLKQSPITLTVVGTAGPATFDGIILNIPQYSAGSACINCNADSLKKLPVDTTSNRDGYILAFDSVDHKWYLTPNAGSGSGITQLTGDATAGPGSGSQPITFTTVNSNVGTFGSASTVYQGTVNGKGLTTAASSVAIQIAESQVTNLTSDLAAKLSIALTSGNLFVGNGSNVATGVALTGDASITNAGLLTNLGLKGAALPSLAAGNLKYTGSAWVFDNSGSASLAATQVGFGSTSNLLIGNHSFLYDSTLHREMIDSIKLTRITFRTDTLTPNKIVFNTIDGDTATNTAGANYIIGMDQSFQNPDNLSRDAAVGAGWNRGRQNPFGPSFMLWNEYNFLGSFGHQNEVYYEWAALNGKTGRVFAYDIAHADGYTDYLGDIDEFHWRTADTSVSHNTAWMEGGRSGEIRFKGATAALGIANFNGGGVSITPSSDGFGNVRFTNAGVGAYTFDDPISIEAKPANNNNVLNISNMTFGDQIGISMTEANGNGSTSFNLPLQIHMPFDVGIFSQHTNTSSAAGAISQFSFGANNNQAFIDFNDNSVPNNFHFGRKPGVGIQLTYNNGGALNNGFIWTIDQSGRTAFGSTAPDASAQIDVQGTSLGFLPPRLNSTQQNAVSSPATGLMIYNTDSLNYCVYNGSAWRKVSYSASTGIATIGSFSGSSQANGASISGSTITFGPADATNPGMVSTGAQTITGAKTLSSSPFISSGNFTGSLGSGSAQIYLSAATLTDNSSSGTIGQRGSVDIFTPTFAASSATTYTNAASLYVNGSPGAGTNVTITNPWTLHIGSGNSLFQGGIYAAHYIDNSATPGIAAGVGAGTSPTVSITGADQGGIVTVTTGTLPTGTNAVIATITFASSYSFPNNSFPVLCPANAITAGLSGVNMVFTTGNITNWTITSGTTALTAATTYQWYYSVRGK